MMIQILLLTILMLLLMTMIIQILPIILILLIIMIIQLLLLILLMLILLLMTMTTILILGPWSRQRLPRGTALAGPEDRLPSSPVPGNLPGEELGWGPQAGARAGWGPRRSWGLREREGRGRGLRGWEPGAGAGLCPGWRNGSFPLPYRVQIHSPASCVGACATSSAKLPFVSLQIL